MNNWFLLAIIAMLCWSGSDLFSKMGSRPEDRLSHWKMVTAVGLVMGLHALYEVFHNGVLLDLHVVLAYLPASALYILSMVLGYIGLRYIELSISSPICNTSGAVAALFLFLFFGEALSLPQGLAVLAMAAGVVLLAIVESREDESIKLERQKAENLRYTRSILALLLPILYCVIDAAGTVADAVILEKLAADSRFIATLEGLGRAVDPESLETMAAASANVAYELTFLLMGILAAVYVFGVRREKVEIPREGPKLLAGLCETAGQFAYVFAIAANAVGSAPIISCYCLVSVLWSRLLLKEKLSWKHYAAIGLAAVGIVAMGVLDEL